MEGSVKFMKNKISYALLGAALLTSVAAQADESTMPMASPASACNFSGFYLGGGAGYDMTGDAVNYVYKAAIGGGGGLVNDFWNNELGLNGFRGGVIAGWGKEFTSRFYAGIDANYLFGDSKAKEYYSVNGEETHGEFKKKDSWSVGVRFGKVFNNTLVYLYGGYASAKFSLKTTTVKVQDINESKDINGFSFGGGLDMKLSQKILLGLSYTYTDFGKWEGDQYSVDKTATPPTPVNDANHIQYKHNFKSHNVMLRLAYTF